MKFTGKVEGCETGGGDLVLAQSRLGCINLPGLRPTALSGLSSTPAV